MSRLISCDGPDESQAVVKNPGHHLNYMGDFKISLSHKTQKGAIYRIHGNNNPQRVGRRVTGGCFVMDNVEGQDLARMVPIGTKVNILP